MASEVTTPPTLLLWVEPIIETLDISETEGINHRGRDGGRNLDSTLS